MVNPVNSSANGAHSSSASDGKAPRMSQEEVRKEAKRMADALKAYRGFDVSFNGPDLTITGKDGDDAILITKRQDGRLRVQAEDHFGYYDILPDVRSVTVDVAGGDQNGILVDPNIQRPFTLIADGSLNIIEGGAGDDTIIGNGSNTLIDGYINKLKGGAGDDTIIGNGLNNWLFGGPGNDHIEVGPDSFSRVDGEDGDDHIQGDTGNDELIGGAGNDHIQGGGGNDEIIGGKGDDIIFGNDGDDLIRGGEGNDILIGGDGGDVIVGGSGRNQIDGGAGNDRLVVDNSSDTIWGGPGDDAVSRKYPKDTGSEATVIDNPDEGSIAHRSSDWWGDKPDYIYFENKE